MLNCAVCGYENLPITDASVYGFAGGHSLRMVERCHKCGARITEKCLVCRRFHPLGTIHCSLSGVKVQDFIDQRADVKTRLEAFKNSDDYNEIFWWRKLSKRLLLGIDAFLIVVVPTLIYRHGSTLSNPEFEHFVTGAILFSVVAGFLTVAIEALFYRDYFDSKVRKLWHKIGNKERLNIFWGESNIQDAELISLLEQKVEG